MSAVADEQAGFLIGVAECASRARLNSGKIAHIGMACARNEHPQERRASRRTESDPPAQVLIVGAGPTGLVMALWLTRLGVPVRIIDKIAEPGTTSRAVAV